MGYKLCNYADSVIKLDSNLNPKDFFSPADEPNRTGHDYDLGSSGALVIPTLPGANPSNLLVQGGKEGDLYMLNIATTTGSVMGGYRTNMGADSVVWEKLGGTILNSGDPANGLCFGWVGGKECGMYSSAAWWNAGNSVIGTRGFTSYVYVAPEGNAANGGSFSEIVQYTLCPGSGSIFGGTCTDYTSQAGLVLGSVSDRTTNPLGFPGLTPIVTSASETDTSAVLWALNNDRFQKTAQQGNYAGLYAYDATSLGLSFWDSTSSSDEPGPAVQFTIPLVANGKVYVGGVNQLTVYTLR